MNRTTIILIIFLIASLISFSGCTSPSNSSINTSPIPFNQSSQQVNNTLESSKSVNYEASGNCNYVVDGDTIDVEGVGRIRFVGVNTPERGQAGYQEAKDFVTSLCLGKNVGLDIDNAKHYDKYGRVLAVVYAGDTNVNAELLKRGYAEIMYIPPSEFNPYSWAGTTNPSVSRTSNRNFGYYMGNSNSMKFHKPDCSAVAKMSEANKVHLNSRQDAINAGYMPCGICNP